MAVTVRPLLPGEFWEGRKPGMAIVQILATPDGRVQFAVQPDNKFGDLPRIHFLRRYRKLQTTQEKVVS